jgi:plastocyanin
MSRVEERTEAETAEEPRSPRLPGVVYPLLALVFGAILVWSFSRILLAVDKDQAVAIATLMAVNILIGSALVAYGKRVKGWPVSLPLLVVAAFGLIVAGTVAAVAFGDKAPEEEQAAGPPQQEQVSLTAQNIAFVQTELHFTSGAKVALTFDNQDAGTPHNFVLFDGTDASAPPLFRGEVVTGPTTIVYDFTAPAQDGDYFFHCEVHPNMTGTASVVAGGPPPGGPPPSGGPPPPGGALELHAANTAFSPTTLSATSTDVTIHFVNDDAGIPHNVAVFNGADASAPAIVHSDLLTGPANEDVTLTLPGNGTFFFHCDVHPTQMTGTITLSG